MERFFIFQNTKSGELRAQRYRELTAPLLDSEIVRQMDGFIQHGTTTTLTHCENVAWVCFVLSEVLPIVTDEPSLITAALLHDLYLYDWHDGEPCRKTHGFDHPAIACGNAVKYFHIGEKEQASILSHMWPLTIRAVPKSREGVILCLADKYCALLETMGRRSPMGPQ